jgi:serine phosphatase RsbU (regulator of sigma subunit)
MNPLYYVQNDQLHEIKATRMGIGGIQLRHDLQFELHTIDISKPTMLYLASDGYADQIGGKEDKKFMSRKFKELLFSIHHLYPEMQKENLNLTLLEWIGLKPQIDDIMVIGIKV